MLLPCGSAGRQVAGGAHAGSAVTSETRVLDADTAGGEWRVVRPRETEVEYDVTHRGDHLFIALRDKDAPNSRLVVAPLADPSRTTASVLPRNAFCSCRVRPLTVSSRVAEGIKWMIRDALNSWRAYLMSGSRGWELVRSTACAGLPGCTVAKRRRPRRLRSRALGAQTLLEHRDDVKLEHVVVARDWLIVFQRANGLQAAVAYRLPGVIPSGIPLRLLLLRSDGCM